MNDNKVGVIESRQKKKTQTFFLLHRLYEWQFAVIFFYWHSKLFYGHGISRRKGDTWENAHTRISNAIKYCWRTNIQFRYICPCWELCKLSRFCLVKFYSVAWKCCCKVGGYPPPSGPLLYNYTPTKSRFIRISRLDLWQGLSVFPRCHRRRRLLLCVLIPYTDDG